MASRLLSQYGQKLEALELIPSGGGCFELTADDELIYSKLKSGLFPDETKLAREIGQRLASQRKSGFPT